MQEPPIAQHRPRPHPRKRPPRPATTKARWGWIEWYILSQSALQAMLFVPGIAPIRPVIRISSFLTGMLAWWFVSQGTKSSPDAKSFPARPWLIFSTGWLLLSIAHPSGYSIPASIGQAFLYISVLSPAFWAGESIDSPRQLNRIMAILFLCNALSASVGLAQVYSDRFLPPVIPVASGLYEGDALKINVNGRMIFRPCGLSDSPGAAAPAGSLATLIGLCFVMRPIGILKRIFCVGMAFIGVAVIYYTQIRSTIVVMIFCLLTQMVLLILQGRIASALSIVAGGASMLVGAIFWVARRMGGEVFTRFSTLWNSNQSELYGRSRGGFVWEALTQTIWEYPLGMGLGWWGMVHVMFANPLRPSLVWVEVMIPAWIVDGGIPLLIAYSGAVGLATVNSLRIALTSKDQDVSFWATVIVGQNIAAIALCFSYVTFLTVIGTQFWILNAALHAADMKAKSLEKARPARPGSTARNRPRRRMPRPWPPGHAAT